MRSLMLLEIAGLNPMPGWMILASLLPGGSLLPGATCCPEAACCLAQPAAWNCSTLSGHYIIKVLIDFLQP